MVDSTWLGVDQETPYPRLCIDYADLMACSWSKPEGLEVRLPIRPAMKSEALNEKIRYSLKRVPNYF